MTDEFPTMSIDKARPGIIRYQGADELTGILAGLHAAEIVRRCNAFPALLSICEKIEAHCRVETGVTGAAHAAEGEVLRKELKAAIAAANS